LHFILSLSFFSLFANRPREGEDLLEIFFWSPEILQIPSFCRLQLGLEGGEEPEADAARIFSSPSDSSTSRRPKPPVKARHPAGTLARAPPRSDSGQNPHAALDIAVPAMSTPAEPAQHRPPPVASPHHQASLEPLNQFPKIEFPERDRASLPDHADVCQSGRLDHAVHATAFPCTPPSPGLALRTR
jgi:hypothetical protein